MANEYKKIIAGNKIEAGKLMTSKEFKNCNIIIHTAATAAGASGIIPIPIMDSIPISATQVSMVIALGKVFDQKITESVAKGVIGAAASTLVGRSLVKLIPIAGWIASASVAAGVTEAIGWSIAVDFAKMCHSSEESSYFVYEDVAYSDDTVANDYVMEEESKNTDTIILNDDITDTEIINDDIIKETSENSDDESVANDFSKVFEAEDE